MVAGILHHAGVHMGSSLQTKGTKHNRKGLYEDLQFYRLNHALASFVDEHQVWRFDTVDRFPAMRGKTLAQTIHEYKQRIEQEERPIYGLKEPLLAVAWQYVKDVIPGEKRIIVVHRKWSSSIQSMMQVRSHIGQPQMAQAQIERMYALILMHIYDIVYTAEFPVLHVQYSDILADPDGETCRLLDFVTDGTDIPLDYDSARQFISPELCTYA